MATFYRKMNKITYLGGISVFFSNLLQFQLREFLAKLGLWRDVLLSKLNFWLLDPFELFAKLSKANVLIIC